MGPPIISLFQQIDTAETQKTDDHSGQENASHDGSGAFLKVHIQEGGCQHAGPGPGSRDRDSDEEQEGPVKSPAGLGFQFLAAAVSLFDTEGEEFSDEPLILTPFQNLSCKEVNDRYGKHVPDDTDDIGSQQRDRGIQNESSDGDRSTKLYKGYHGYQKCKEITHEHKMSLFYPVKIHDDLPGLCIGADFLLKLRHSIENSTIISEFRRADNRFFPKICLTTSPFCDNLSPDELP